MWKHGNDIVLLQETKWRVIIGSFAFRVRCKVYHFWLHQTDGIKNKAGAGILLVPVACGAWKRAGGPEGGVGAARLVSIELHFLD
jgi:hypothetical protein